MASPALDPDREAFRMPAEWEPHEATWLGWPHNLSDWPVVGIHAVELVWGLGTLHCLTQQQPRP